MSGRTDALRDAFYAAPDDDAGFLAVYRALIDARDIESLIEVYRVRAGAVGGEEALFLNLTVAEVWSQRLGMPGMATEALFAAFELEPSELLRERLSAHLHQHRDWTMLARLLAMETQQAAPGLERGRALLRFGHFLAERLHDIGEAGQKYVSAADEAPELYTAALTALQRLRRAEPNSGDVARSLSALLGSGSSPERTLQALEQELDRLREGDDQGKASLQVQLAQVHLEGLGDTQRAVSLVREALALHPNVRDQAAEILHAVVDAEPGALDALRLLRDLELSRGQWVEAIRLVKQEELLAGDDTIARFALLMERGEIEAANAGAERAVDTFLAAYQLRPGGHEAVRTALHRLLTTSPHSERIRNAMVFLLEADRDADGLARLWARIAEQSESEAERCEALWRKGRAQLELGLNPHGALRTWSEATERAPVEFQTRLMLDIQELYDVHALRPDVVDVVRRLATGLERWDVLCDLLSRHADGQTDPLGRAATLLELGEILEHRLGDHERALTAYRAAFRACPEHLAVVRAMRRTYVALGDVDQARGFLDIELRLAESPGDRALLNAERARLDADHGAPLAVLESYAAVLRFDPHQEEAAAKIRELVANHPEVLDDLAAGEGLIGAEDGAAIASVLCGEDASTTAGVRLYRALLDRGLALDAAAFDQLEARVADDWRVSSEVLLARIKVRSDAAERQDALARLTALQSAVDSSDLDMALSRARLEIQPSPERFDSLLDLLEAIGDAKALCELNLWAADNAPWIVRRGTEARIAMFWRAADLSEERRESILRRILELSPNETDAIAWFREHLVDDPLGYYQVLAPSAPAAREPIERAERQAELAELSQRRIGDTDRAVFHWNQVLGNEDAPEEIREQAYGALRALYREREQLDALSDLVRARAAAATTPEAKVESLWELVTLQRESTRDRSATRRTLQRILRIDRNESRALASLAEMQMSEGEHASAAELLERLVAVTSGDQERRHRLRLARLLGEQIGSWREAVEVLRGALDARPADRRAIRELGRLLLDGSPDEISERRKVWADVVAAEIARLETPEALGLEPEVAKRERLELNRLRASVLSSDIDQADEAIAAWRAVLDEEPVDLGAITSLGVLLCDLGRWGDAAEHYRAMAAEFAAAAASGDESASSGVRDRVELLVRLGDVLWMGLEDGRGALAAYREATALEPGHIGALQATVSVARMVDGYEAQTAALADLAAALPSAEQRPIRLELAALHETAGDLSRAIATLDAVVDADPLDEDALYRLRDLLVAADRPAALAEVLGRLSGLAAEIDERIVLRREQATLFEQRLHDDAAALEVHKTILSDRPRDPDSLHALALLNQKIGSHDEALSALESLIRAAPERRVETIVETAELFENVGQTEEAFARYRWAYELDSAHQPALLAMWRLARGEGFWSELVEVLEQEAMRLVDAEAQSALLSEVADLTEVQLGDSRRAFHILRMAYQAFPSDEILGSLERVGRDGEFWQELAVLYRSLSEVGRADDQIEYLYRVADLTAQHLANPESAFDVLLEVVDEYPDHEPTRQRLISLTEHYGLWSRYCEHLDELAEMAESARERRDYLVEAAALARDRVDDAEGALARLLAALELDPSSPDLIEAIGELSAPGVDPWPRALEILELSVHGDDRERVATTVLLRARIVEGRQNDPDGAYRALLDGMRLTLDQRVFDSALKLGARLGRLDELADALQTAIGVTLERDHALLLLDRQARVFEQAQRWADSIGALRRILELDPNNESAADRLRQLTLDDEHVNELLRTLDHQAERLSSSSERAEKRFEMARLLESQNRLVEAADAYERALRDAPRSTAARRQLIVVATRLERWQAAAEHLLLMIAQTDGDERREAIFQLAEVYAQRLDLVDKAHDILRRHLDREPSDTAAMERIAEILHAAGRSAELMSAWERRAQQTPDQDERRACLLNLAALAEHEFNNAKRALDALLVVVEEDGEERDLTVFTSLARLYVELRDYEGAADAAKTAATLAGPSSEERARLLELQAHLLIDHLDAPAIASEVLDDLTRVQPENGAAWSLRGDLLRQLGRLDDARDSWVQALEHLDEDEAADVWVKIGEVLWRELGAPDMALDAFERALELSPRHREAAAALREIAAGSDDPRRLLSAMTVEINQLDGEERIPLLWQRAVLERDQVRAERDAEETLASALELADDYACLRDLADLRFARSAWAEAAEGYARLVTMIRPGDLDGRPFPADRLGLYLRPEDPDRLVFEVRLAFCYEKLDGYHDAIKHYRSAYEHHRRHPAVLVGLSRCYYYVGNWSRARKHLARTLRHADKLDLLTRDRARLSYFLGDILNASNDPQGALDAFDGALEASENYRPAADQRVSVLIDQKRWTETVPAFYHLLRLTEDEAVRGAIFKRLGEVHEYFLDEPMRAVAAYEQAMLCGGEDTYDIPERLLRLYVRNELWEKAHVLARGLVDESSDGSHTRVEYLVVLGDILMRGLGQLDAARDTYAEAYSVDSDNLLALERLASVYATRGDLDGMADVYTDHLTTIDAEDVGVRTEVLKRYGDQLVDICAAPHEAIAVYQNLAQLVPEDTSVHRTLGELYRHSDVASPRLEIEHVRAVIGLHQFSRSDLLRLVELYADIGDALGYSTLASFIRFVDGADDDKPTPPRQMSPGSLAGDVYESWINDPESSGPLARLFEAIWQLHGTRFEASVAGLGLARCEELTQKTQMPAVGIFHGLTRALGLDKRRLFAQSDDDVPVRVVASKVPAIVVSRDLLRSLLGAELGYFLASALELTRPHALLACSLSPLSLVTLISTLVSELAPASDGARKRPSLVERSMQDEVRKFIREIRSKHSVEAQRDLEHLVAQVVEHDPNPSARRYLDAVRSSATRIGLLACGSQSAALRRILKQERGSSLYRPRDFDDFSELMRASSDLDALVQYVISDEYLEAQRQVGRTTPDSTEPLASLRATGSERTTESPIVAVDEPDPDAESLESFGDLGLESVLDGLEDLAAEALQALDDAAEALASQTAPVPPELVQGEEDIRKSPSAFAPKTRTMPGDVSDLSDVVSDLADIGALEDDATVTETADESVILSAVDLVVEDEIRFPIAPPAPPPLPPSRTGVSEVIELDALELEFLDDSPGETPPEALEAVDALFSSDQTLRPNPTGELQSAVARIERSTIAGPTTTTTRVTSSGIFPTVDPNSADAETTIED